MFSEDEKKWIVLEFARTASPAVVRRAFLAQLFARDFSHIEGLYPTVALPLILMKGRATVGYKPSMFTRVCDHFKDFGSVQRKKNGRK